MHTYGFDVHSLDSLIQKPVLEKTEWGVLSHTSPPKNEYALKQVFLKKDRTCTIHTGAHQEATVFLEEGRIKKERGSSLAPHTLFSLSPFARANIFAESDSYFYIFYEPRGTATPLFYEIQSTHDKREKYWGSIETIINRNITGKRLFFEKGKNSSLHFHCSKNETYYIHSGKLLVRLRAGRGEDYFVTLDAGSTLFIPPGLMHQDGGLEDTVIIEISTHDEDRDSFIVEDGEKHPMSRLLNNHAAP